MTYTATGHLSSFIRTLPYLFLFSSWIVLIWACFNYLNEDGNSLFKWHPICMGTAFLFFITHGILSYRAPIKAIPLGDSRSLHGFFQYTGAFIAGVGIVIVIIQNKYISHSSTIPSSTHAILGTTTLSILALTLVMGLIKFIILPSTFRLFKLHGLFGIITYILALTTLCYGVSEVFGCHEEEVPDNGNVTDAMQVVQVCKGKYLPTIIYTLVSGLGASVMLAHALLSFPGTACDQDNLELLIQASQRDMIF